MEFPVLFSDRGVCSSRFWALLALGLLAAACSAEPRRPNIVYILADDLGWTDAGVFGSRFYETPNIDGLAADGMRFTSYHVNANCQPTRAALLTGQYSPRTGVYTVGKVDRFDWRSRPLVPVPNQSKLPLDRATIADALSAAGYATAMFGKWHLGEDADHHPSRRGFKEAIATSMDDHFTFRTNPDTPRPDGQYLADFVTDRALDFISRHRQQPFFVYLSHFAVHVPMQARQEYIARFEGKSPAGGHYHATYAAMIASVDESVGRIREHLRKLGLDENTIVVFASDNGGVGGYRREGIENIRGDLTDNAPLRAGKGTYYEGGTRVPLLVAWPNRVAAGSRCDLPTIHVDWFPTLLEVTGAAAPKGQALDGESLLPLLLGRATALRREAIFQHFPGYLGAEGSRWRSTPVSTIIQGDWKLMEFHEEKHLELYDLKSDLGETKNLAATEPARAQALHARLQAWRAEIGAQLPAPNLDRQPPRPARKAAAGGED